MRKRRKHNRSSGLPYGIVLTEDGFRCSASDGERIRQKRFPPDTDVSTMMVWIGTIHAKRNKEPGDRLGADTDGTFGRDVERYLPARAAMPSYKDRARHLRRWVQIFGPGRDRQSITAVEIQAQRDAWVLAGKSPSWINHHLTALSNLWTVLDGRRAPNPVRDVSEVEQRDPQPRGLPYAVIEAILEKMPERGAGLKGIKRTGYSKSRARLAVIAYTGLAHTQVKQLQPTDVDLDAGTVFMRSRKKGPAGHPRGRVKPLLPEGIAALKRFVEVNAWGSFSNQSLRKSFQRACALLAKDRKFTRAWPAINLKMLRPYDFRHSYATAVLKGTGSLRETQELMGHASEKTTMRYALAAVAPHLAAALLKVSPFVGTGRRAPQHPAKILHCYGCQKILGSDQPVKGLRNRKFCSARCMNTHVRRLRRAWKRTNGPVEDISSVEVFERDGYICQLCLKPVTRTAVFPDPASPSLDHRTPLVLGGTHVLSNLQTAHLLCNIRKGARITEGLTATLAATGFADVSPRKVAGLVAGLDELLEK